MPEGKDSKKKFSREHLQEHERHKKKNNFMIVVDGILQNNIN